MVIGFKKKLKKALNTSGMRKGFSLAELMAAITIGAMVMVAVLGIYNRAESSAAAVINKLNSSRLSSEVLQRIAEDLDRVISSGSDTKIIIENKFKNGYPASKLTITRTVKDRSNRERKFEEITWQSLYDYESPYDGLVLYRSYSGIALEDRLLDRDKDELDLERLVPVCSGVTYFKITAIKGGAPVEKWDAAPPSGITATISFAEPFKGTNGTLDVLDDEKTIRTIAIDRTREIRFTIETPVTPEDGKTPTQTERPEEKSSPPGRRGTIKTER